MIDRADCIADFPRDLQPQSAYVHARRKGDRIDTNDWAADSQLNADHCLGFAMTVVCTSLHFEIMFAAVAMYSSGR